MYHLFKKTEIEWELISLFDNINDALFEMAQLNQENEYRIERIDGSNSEILEN